MNPLIKVQREIILVGVIHLWILVILLCLVAYSVISPVAGSWIVFVACLSYTICMIRTKLLDDNLVDDE